MSDDTTRERVNAQRAQLLRRLEDLAKHPSKGAHVREILSTFPKDLSTHATKDNIRDRVVVLKGYEQDVAALERETATLPPDNASGKEDEPPAPAPAPAPPKPKAPLTRSERETLVGQIMWRLNRLRKFAPPALMAGFDKALYSREVLLNTKKTPDDDLKALLAEVTDLQQTHAPECDPRKAELLLRMIAACKGDARLSEEILFLDQDTARRLLPRTLDEYFEKVSSIAREHQQQNTTQRPAVGTNGGANPPTKGKDPVAQNQPEAAGGSPPELPNAAGASDAPASTRPVRQTAAGAGAAADRAQAQPAAGAQAGRERGNQAAATAQQSAAAATAPAETAVAVTGRPRPSARSIHRVLALQAQLLGLNRDHPLVKVAPKREDLEGQWQPDDVDALIKDLEPAVAAEENRARERQAQRPQPAATWWQAVASNQGRMLFRLIAVVLVVIVLLGLIGSRMGLVHFGRDAENGAAGAAAETPLKVIPRRFKD